MKKNLNLLQSYKACGLIPFSLSIKETSKADGKITKTLKSVYEFSKISEYNDDYIDKSFKTYNGLAIRMGTPINGGYVIGLDIDNKPDGTLLKWTDILLQHNINSTSGFTTPTAKTGNNGYHYLFKVTDEQFKNISTFTGLTIDNVKYSIDLKAGNQFLLVEPTKYTTYDKKCIKKYEWVISPANAEIMSIPAWVYDLVKTKVTPAKPQSVGNVSPINIKADSMITELLKILSPSRMDNYFEWVQIGILIKCLNIPNGFDIWDDMSKSSTKYEAGVCAQKWDTFNYNSCSIKTLFYFAKHDNPQEYSNILRKYNYQAINGDLKTEIIEINQRYLLDLEKKLGDDTVLCQNIHKLFTDETVQCLNLRSPYDTGKTQMLKEIIRMHKPQRILWVSYRRTLTYDILGNFEKEFGFKNYLDGQYDADRLIVQIESLGKLNYIFDDAVPAYNLIIIDEIESILNQFSSFETFKGKTQETFYFLRAIIDATFLKGGKMIALDGDLKERTYNFTKKYNCINVWNKIIFNKKSLNIISYRDDFEQNMFATLNAGERFVMPTMSEKEAEYYTALLKEKYPTKIIRKYTSKTSDMDKLALKNVVEEWKQADVVIYTPTISAGVNFDLEHFDRIFGILSAGSCSQRDFFQMLARVRKIKYDDIYLLNHGQFKNNEVVDYWKIEEVKSALIETKSVDVKKKYMIDGNKMKAVVKLDDYDENYIYNKVEELNKQTYYFLSLFIQMANEKGFKVNNETVSVPKTEEGEKHFMIKKLLEVPDINEDEYEQLLNKQQRAMATEAEKNKVDRAVHKKRLGVDQLNEEILAKYYKRTDKVLKFLALVDPANIHHKDQNEDMIYKQKVQLVTDLINGLGFGHVLDNNMIDKDVFIENLNNQLTKNPIFSDNNETQLLFEYRNKNLKTFRGTMGYINTVLEGFGLTIKAEQARVNGGKNKSNFYKLVVLDGVDDIIKFRINNGENIKDSRHIITNEDGTIKNTRVDMWTDLIHDSRKCVVSGKVNIKNQKIDHVNVNTDMLDRNVDVEN